MFLCDYLRGGLIILASLLILLVDRPSFSVVVLFVVGVIGNAIGSVFAPAATALLPSILPESQLLQANSYMSVLSSFQSILGAVLAAVLYAALPVTGLFLLVGSCYLLSGVSEMFIRYKETASSTGLTLRSSLTDLKDGFRYVAGNRILPILIGVILLINFFFAPVMENFFPYFIKTDVAGHDYLFSSVLSPESWSSVLSIFIGIASIVFAMVLSARKRKEKIGRSTAGWLSFLSVLLIALTLAYALLVAHGEHLNLFLVLLCLGAFLIGMAITFINIPISTALQILSDKDKLGKVSSVMNMGSQGLIPVSVFLAGYVVDLWGCTALLAICSAGFTAASLYALLSRRFREM